MTMKHGETRELRAESLRAGAEKIHLWFMGLRFFLRTPRSALRTLCFYGFRRLGFVRGPWSIVHRQLLCFVFFASLFTLHPSLSFANNLSISNVSLEDRDAGADTVVVQFNISWDNAWRNDTNHDAAWIFIKACEDNCASTGWEHADLLNPGLSPAGTSPGTANDPQIEILIPTDKTGAFIRPKSSHTGTINAADVRLTVDYSSFGAADTDQIQVKVFGIEMVYIPQGDFDIGDGNASNESTYAFHVTDNTAARVTSSMLADVTVDSNGNDDIDTSVLGIDGDGGIDTDDDGSVDNALFPTGWQPFYLMKYELTQGQYRDFLNTLSRAQQTNRVAEIATASDYAMTDAATVTYRDAIRLPASLAGSPNPEVFGCDLAANSSSGDGVFDQSNDGEWIAMNYLSWMDLAAYADWAGLRPMTELEYEKAARGPEDAVYNEYAWGTTDLTDVSYIEDSGMMSEYSLSSGSGLALNEGSGYGPARVGFTATASTSRVQAGAGYYGNMNLDGNVSEQTVTVGNTTGRSFEGSHGDGTLTTTSSYEGNATNTDWPGIDGTAARGVTGATGSGFRGANFYGSGSTVYSDGISNREYAADSSTTRDKAVGGRLARSKPFEECGDYMYVFHDDADGVAPADTFIRYATVKTNLTGKDACWITQNLGATQVATSATDATEASGGWYWQFNDPTGWDVDDVSGWNSSIDEDSDWLPANDPCTLELGEGWRLPTSTEWTNADSNGSWGDYNDTYGSVLKIHAAGYGCGSGDQGSSGWYWSNTQDDSSLGYLIYVTNASSGTTTDYKTLGSSSRCLNTSLP